MIGQALELKGDIETRRAANTFGILVWQFNEIWPTGGWGTIEYGSPVPGQVLGGRWKPAHYWYAKSIFSDVMASCGVGGACYLKNDAPTPHDVRVVVTAYRFDTGAATVLASKKVALKAGPGVMEWFNVVMPPMPSEAILTAVVTSAHGQVLSDNLIPLTPPSQMELHKARVTYTVGKLSATGSVPITLTTDVVAVYVTLTTQANGRFSDNAFLLLPSAPTTVDFLPFGALEMQKLIDSLRVEDASAYM